MLKKLGLIVLITTSLLISSCGFHLREMHALPPQMKVLFINSSAPYDTLTQSLTQVLQSNHVYVTDHRDAAPVALKIFDESYKTDTLSDSASSTTKLYVLYYTVYFALQDPKGKTIYGPNRIVVSRNYMVNENQVLSMGNETEKLRKDMQRDAMFQILNQLSSPAVAEAVSHLPAAVPAPASHEDH